MQQDDFVDVSVPVDARTLAGLPVVAARKKVSPEALAAELIMEALAKGERVNMQMFVPPKQADLVVIRLSRAAHSALEAKARGARAPSVASYAGVLLARNVPRVQ